MHSLWYISDCIGSIIVNKYLSIRKYLYSEKPGNLLNPRFHGDLVPLTQVLKLLEPTASVHIILLSDWTIFSPERGVKLWMNSMLEDTKHWRKMKVPLWILDSWNCLDKYDVGCVCRRVLQPLLIRIVTLSFWKVVWFCYSALFLVSWMTPATNVQSTTFRLSPISG